jgi:hypothetical protein
MLMHMLLLVVLLLLQQQPVKPATYRCLGTSHIHTLDNPLTHTQAAHNTQQPHLCRNEPGEPHA